MALSIYESADSATVFSEGGSFTNPFAVSLDGRNGGVREIKVYLRNNDATKYYTSITVGLEDTDTTNHVDGTETGYEWKLIAGDQQPTEYDWDQVAAANTISLANLGSAGTPNTSTYLPFWVYIKIPRHVSVQSVNTVSFVVTATETLV